MSISYSGVVGFGSGKVTLPSVETWGANMNILRDPPKAIYTRKIDKVGQTSEITQMIDYSGDRVCEAILPYARGVNPMVGVSYDNYGNNGGQKSGGVARMGLDNSGSSGKNAYLPYRIMNGGAFRPPVKDQRDLLPLSRLPRVWTSSFTQPGFADFSKKAICQGDNYRNVRKEESMLRACIRPTATYQLETPIIENYEITSMIKNPVKVSVTSGIEARGKVNGEMGEVHGGLRDVLQVERTVNKSGQGGSTPSRGLVTENYIQDRVRGQYGANKSSSQITTSIQDVMNINPEQHVQERVRGSFASNRSENRQVTPISELLADNPENNIQERVKGSYGANRSLPINTTSIEEVMQTPGNVIRESFTTDYNTPMRREERNDFSRDSPLVLDSKITVYNTNTDKRKNIHVPLGDYQQEREYTNNRPNTSAQTRSVIETKYEDFERKAYNLKPTVSGGSFSPTPMIPTNNREELVPEFDTQKMKLRENVYTMQQDRNTAIGAIPFQDVYG